MRSARISNPLGHLVNYHCYLLQGKTHPRSRSPISSILGYHKISSSFANYGLNISVQTEPKTFKSAVKDPKWVKAMNDE